MSVSRIRTIGRQLSGCAAVAGFVMLGQVPGAQAAGDIQNGERLAGQWCGGCHLIASDQAEGADAAPPFAAIAADSARSDDSLLAWLSDPHPPMPKLDLTEREIQDLAAYIRSLDGN